MHKNRDGNVPNDTGKVALMSTETEVNNKICNNNNNLIFL